MSNHSSPPHVLPSRETRNRRGVEEEASMEATVREIGHVSVVDLSGKITIGEGDIVLKEKVYELLENGQQHILLNLKDLSYMDACGIGELLACYNRAKEKSGTIKLLSPSAKVCDLLELTKLKEVFETFCDEKEALVSFSRRPVDSPRPCPDTTSFTQGAAPNLPQ